MFKFKITLDRHNAGLKFNCCLRFGPPNFSLPSTFNSPKKTRRFAPPTIGASLLLIHPPEIKKINYFQIQNTFLQAQTLAAGVVYLSTGLICTQLSYIAPYWQRCNLLSYAAPYWSTVYPTELHCPLLNHAATSLDTQHPYELRCTTLSSVTLNWATLHPIWATLHPLS